MVKWIGREGRVPARPKTHGLAGARPSIDRIKSEITVTIVAARDAAPWRFARDFGCSVVGPETGSLNSELFFCLVKRQKPFVEVLLEDTQPATVAESAAFVRRIWRGRTGSRGGGRGHVLSLLSGGMILD